MSSLGTKLYGDKQGAINKNSNAYVDPYIEKMDDAEINNYDMLRKRGFKTDESLYHATNPRGRLFPEGTPDPWAPLAGKK